MTRNYRFAGVELSVSMPEELFFTSERNLEPFQEKAVSNPHLFRFEIVDDLPAPEGELLVVTPSFRIYARETVQSRYIGLCKDSWEGAYLRVVHSGIEHFVQLKRNAYTTTVGVKNVLESISAEHLIARNHGFVFHCSYIDHQGKAILFTAPSETGKSTQADLWHDLRGAQIINGDRAAVRLVDGILMAEGIPFAGSSKHCKNRSLPIAAIVYLGQAPQTTIRRMRGYEAFAKIWEGVSVNTWDKQDMEAVSNVVQQAASRIPVFHLPCTPDESAVIALEQALREKERT